MKRLIFTALCFGCALAFAQPNNNNMAGFSSARTPSSGLAEEEFRRGVQSYYRGAFNEAILEFEKALSYLPGENLILDWLGRSYYRSGVEGAALQQWNYAREQGYGGILLQNRIEIVSQRRITLSEEAGQERYTESGSYPYRNGETLVYSQPVSCLPEKDGTIWVLAAGSNELLRFNVNGVVIDRNRGPLNGFDRPLDIIRLLDGNMLVSESRGNRLSLLDSSGKFIKYIGSRGIDEGQFVGPQYLAQDYLGNIYVTDFGNSRVVVFDPDGNPLFHFGTREGSFDGLKAPTGIAIQGDRVFVADNVKGCIYEFDRSGNYTGLLVDEGKFRRPESLKQWGNTLIVCDVNKVVTVDTDSGSVFENASAGNGDVRITCAVPDVNGNLVVTDCYANEIYVLAKMDELVGGLFVQVERVYAEKFPQVTLEVRVENRKRQQITGLKQENFLITENHRPVTGMTLTGSTYLNDFSDVVLLVDRSLSMKDREQELAHAVREIVAGMNGKGHITLISAGEVPVIEWSGDVNSFNFTSKSIRASYSRSVPLDLSIRLSVNDLINREKKQAVIFITAGKTTDDAFTKYSLSDIASYMNNNAVSFSTVMLSNEAPDDVIDYLTKNTAGSDYYVYSPEGLKRVVSDITALPSGLYQLQYTSSLSPDFGRKYLPVEVELYLLSRSGRDETGYFAPLE